MKQFFKKHWIIIGVACFSLFACTNLFILGYQIYHYCHAPVIGQELVKNAFEKFLFIIVPISFLGSLLFYGFYCLVRNKLKHKK